MHQVLTDRNISRNAFINRGLFFLVAKPDHLKRLGIDYEKRVDTLVKPHTLVKPLDEACTNLLERSVGRQAVRKFDEWLDAYLVIATDGAHITVGHRSGRRIIDGIAIQNTDSRAPPVTSKRVPGTGSADRTNGSVIGLCLLMRSIRVMPGIEPRSIRSNRNSANPAVFWYQAPCVACRHEPVRVIAGGGRSPVSLAVRPGGFRWDPVAIVSPYWMPAARL